MKRAIISLPATLLGSLSLAMFVWLMVFPAITQAAPQIHQPAQPALPFAIPHMATVTVSITEAFPINPPTTSVTVDFNSPSDVAKFQGLSFDGRSNEIGILDYNHPSLGTDGDTELQLTVHEALPYAVYDRHYVYFLNQPITDFVQVDIELLRSPNYSDASSGSGSGIELRSYGPSKLPTGNSTTDANPRVYFSLIRDTATSSLGHRLSYGWRLNNASQLISGTIFSASSFRVHAPSAYKPVWLRIMRSGNNFTFAYKDTAITTTWQSLPVPVTYSVALSNPVYISLFGVAYQSAGSITPQPTSDAVFDNLTYVYTPNQQISLPNWTTTVYGSGTALGATPNTDPNGRLVLKSNGKSIADIDDNTANAGYVLFSYIDPVASSTQFETLVQVITAPTVEGGVGGLEVRNTLASNSAKLSYGLVREGSSYRLSILSRDDSNVVTPIITSTVVNLTTPMWLKITRTPNSNTFNFYRAQKTTLPTSGEWVLYATTDLTMTNQLYAGLFNSSNITNTQQSSYFDNFQMLGAEDADDPIMGLTLVQTRTTAPNQSLQFTATVTGGTNINYSWNFGDGETATGETVNHSYFSVGTYTVTATAVNNVSTASTTTTVIVNEVSIAGLTAINNSPKVPRPNGTTPTSFTATVATGSNVVYSWDFGDGRTNTGQYVSNLYQKAGTYTVIVTASNATGIISTTTTATIVDNPIQGVGFHANTLTPVYEGSPIFMAVFPSPNVAPQATNVTYTWTLPGGVVTSSRTFYYTFPITGSPHPVSVTACNSANCVTKSTDIIIQPIPDERISGFVASSDGPTLIGQQTNFAATVVSGTNIVYEWSFEDGLVLKGQTVSRTLPIGTYKINVIASNNQGFVEEEITTTVYGIPNLIFTKSAPQVIKVGEQIKYTINAVNTGTDTAFDVVVTDTIPAGSTYFSHSGDVDVGTQENNVVVWHLGDLPALRGATMYLTVDRPTSGIVTNSNYILMGQNRISQSIIISGTPITTDVAYPPVANPGPSLDVAPGEFVTLDGSGSYDPDNKPLSFYWQQISGATVTLSGTKTMSPTFVAPAKLGDLLFRLTVTNSSKLADTKTVLVKVSYIPIFDITKQAPYEKNINDLITYTLTITNRGTAPASQVVISDVIPNGAYYVSSSGGFDGGQLMGNAVFWSVDNMPVKSRVVMTLVLTAEANIINRDYSVTSAQNVSAKGKVSVVTLINLSPLVSAGRNQTMLPNMVTTLDGRKTYDPRSLAMTYQWTQVAGTAVTLNNPNSLQPTFTTPSNFDELRFRLTATNSKGLSNFAEVVIKVAPWTAIVNEPVELSCNDSLAVVKSKEPVGVTNGNAAIYIGYQISLGNGSRNPVTMKFTGNVLDWCRTDYETTERDGAGYGLLWDGNNVLYGVYTADGIGSGNDFGGYSGWLNSYVQGSPNAGTGLEVPVVAKIDPTTGNISPTADKLDGHATFITALDASFKVNEVVVNDLTLDNNNLVVQATAWENPRQGNRLALSCNGKSPYVYSLTLTPDLTDVVSAEAVGCKETVTPPGTVNIAGFTTGFFSKTYTFRGSVDPFYVTAPLTYTWYPEPLNPQGQITATYSWPDLGVHAIVLTVENRGGSLSYTHYITITDPLSDVIPLSKVTLTGPITGLINLPYTFKATISPTDAGLPIVYDWSPAPTTGQGSPEVSYTWPNSGTQTINLLVTNLRGEVSATQMITISEPPPIITAPTLVTLKGPLTTTVDHAVTLMATVSPTDVTLPLTYTWQPEPLSGQGSSQVSYMWATTGTQSVSLTVENQAGLTSGSYSITVEMTPTVNQPPIAYNDMVSTTSNIPLTVSVLTNDSDPESDTLMVVSVTSPAHGTAALISGTIIYTPTLGYVGTDSFTYTVNDGHQGTASAMVTVYVLKSDQQVVVVPIDMTTVVTIPNPGGGGIVIEVPGQEEEFVLVYTLLTQSTHLPPTGYDFGGQYLLLEAYVGGQLQTHFTFTRPLTMTMTYRDEDITDVVESTLYIAYWHEISQTWAIDGVVSQPPDVTLNKVTAFIYHLTEFALLGELKPKPKEIYLPIIIRK